MATDPVVWSVAGLWRYPVKSMQGERLEQGELTEGGLVGDRAYALIDAETGLVVSARSLRFFPGMFGCRAAFVEQPRSGGELPPARITFPDGATVTSDSRDVDRVLSGYFRRDVTLARAAVPAGSFFDVFPVSVLTLSTLERLSELRPESRFDQRRFRMNVIVGTGEAGFVENGWIGRELAIGDVVRLGVAGPDPRCAMTTLAQDDLPEDSAVLRTLARHNPVEVAGEGLCPCAGAYAVVRAPGAVRLGDPVVLA